MNHVINKPCFKMDHCDDDDDDDDGDGDGMYNALHCARHCSKCFADNISFNLHNTMM